MVSLALQNAQKYVRKSKPGSSGSMRVKISGLPHFEQGFRSSLRDIADDGRSVILKAYTRRQPAGRQRYWHELVQRGTWGETPRNSE
jgi:uncharacterized membrane protein